MNIQADALKSDDHDLNFCFVVRTKQMSQPQPVVATRAVLKNGWPLISEEDANVAPEHRTPSADLRYSRLLPGGSRSTKRIYTAFDGIPSRGSSATHTRRAERVMGFHQPVSARPQTSKGHKKIVGATNR